MSFSVFLLFVLAFASIYPLCFWIPLDAWRRDRFRRLNITIPNVAGGVILILVWLTDMPLFLKITVSAWKAVLLSVSSYSWRKECPDPRLMTLPSLLGIYAFVRLKTYLDISGGTVSLITESIMGK